MNELVLISVSGEDRPGITATIAKLLGDWDVDVLDVGQSVIHNHLSLGILANVQSDAESVFSALRTEAEKLGVQIRLIPISEESYDEWVGLQGASRYILTLLARKVKASHIAKVSEVIAANGLNIDNITRLSGRVPLVDADNTSKACVEFSLRGTPKEGFREQLLAVCSDLDIDIALQEDGIYRRNRRLIAFDMDSTLIRTEVIDELAIEAGVGDQVAEITARAMAGELDFRESLRKRVGLLEGLPESVLVKVAGRLPLTEGVEHLFETLNHLGYKTAILSGGFTYFGDVLKKKLSVDYVYANELEISDGKLTGRVLDPIVDAERKASLLRELAEQQGISLKQTIAVGDGANDLAMLDVAGLGIAFHAKPLVRESAGHSISNLGLDSLLYLMGIRDAEVREMNR
ncbi:MAG: phosphoserine phosphatase SerB [Pseudomonadales bacterium]|nr:phosphoserine phosphatase SerB [Pseudomonadales bacterium]